MVRTSQPLLVGLRSRDGDESGVIRLGKWHFSSIYVRRRGKKEAADGERRKIIDLGMRRKRRGKKSLMFAVYGFLMGSSGED